MHPRLRPLAALLGTWGLITLAVPQAAGARTPSGFVDGSGAARGTTIRLAPHTGGFTFAVATGDSLASYQGTEGRSQATALDLGLLGLVLTTVSACGQRPPLQHDQLPQPVQANSSHGPTSATHGLLGNDVAAGGTETVTAQPASSSADASAVTMDIPGVMTVGGAVSHAETRLVPGLRREAHADASIASVSLAGGQVVLQGLHWDVTQHTGDQQVQRGDFHVDRVLVAGRPLPGDPLGGAAPGPAEQVVASLDQADRVLENLGMRISPPVTRTLQDGTVEVGPLRIGIGGSTRLSAPLGSALAAAQPGRDALVAALRGDPQSCNDPRTAADPLANAGLLVADIAYGDLTGTGGLDVELGGVHATTEGMAYRNPFGDIPPLAPPGGVATVTDTTPPGLVTTTGPNPPPLAPRAPATPILPATAGHGSTACVTPGSFGRDGCSTHRLARAAAVAGLAIAVLLFAGDALLMFRRRRIGRVHQ